MAYVGQVHADLVGASGFQAALDQAGEGSFGIAELFDKAISRARLFATAAQDGHTFAVERIATDRPFNDAFARPWRAPNDSVIGAFDRVVGKLLGQTCHGALTLGGHE